MALEGVFVKFRNDADTVSYQFQFVQHVIWTNDYSEDLWVDGTTKEGYRSRAIEVSGFILNYKPQNNVTAQEAVETSLRAVGTGVLEYTGATDIPDVRFVSLDWQEYRGNPAAYFTARFITESDNPHSYDDVKIGSIALDPAPTLTDSIGPQAEGEQISAMLNRTFRLTGKFVGTIEEVGQKEADILAAISNTDTVVLTADTGTHTGSFTVRTRNWSTTSPQLVGDEVSRTYSFECDTFDDYDIEPYSLGEVATAYGGITVDRVTSVEYNPDFSRTGVSQYFLNADQVVVKGEKWFTSYTNYATFRDGVNDLTPGANLLVRGNGLVLTLTSVTLGEMERDGFFGTTGPGAQNDKKYKASIELNFEWVKSVEESSIAPPAQALGITWIDITNVSFSVSLNAEGDVKSRGVTVSGRVDHPNYLTLQNKVGTAVEYNGITELYITSISVGGTDPKRYVPSGPTLTFYDINVTTNQLDSDTKRLYFLTDTFDIKKTDSTSYGNVVFDAVTNRSRSLSNEFSSVDQKFVVTSISVSLTGEVHHADDGAGNAPQMPTKIIDLINSIDADLKLSKSTAPATYLFFLNSISAGDWQPFTKNGADFWKQSVSLSATAVFRLSGGGSGQEPEFVDTDGFGVERESPRFASLQVLGFGTVFKKIGVNPAKGTKHYVRTFRDKTALDAAKTGGYLFNVDGNSTPPPPLTVSNSQITRDDDREVRGLTTRRFYEFVATESV